MVDNLSSRSLYLRAKEQPESVFSWPHNKEQSILLNQELMVFRTLRFILKKFCDKQLFLPEKLSTKCYCCFLATHNMIRACLTYNVYCFLKKKDFGFFFLKTKITCLAKRCYSLNRRREEQKIKQYNHLLLVTNK